ncbi:MAG: sensor domain-containing diguanylate cyclase [Thermoleophilia bacterium]
MHIGYGRSRLVWYAALGAALGGSLLVGHYVLEHFAYDFHNLLLLVLIPIMALILAIVAHGENTLYQRTSRLDAARLRVNELMLGAVTDKDLAMSFTDPDLCTCFDTLGCDKEDCPAYGREHVRCWLIAGTFCRGEVQGQFARKLHDCRLCEVYQRATADPVDEITENFTAMNYLLGEGREQLEQALSQARTRSEKLAGLVSMSEAALSSVHLSDLLQNLLESAASLVGADLGLISIADAGGNILSARVTLGFQPGDAERLSARVGEGILGQAFAGRYIIISEDLPHDTRQTNPLLKSAAVRTLVSLPLVSREQPFGMLTLGTLTPHNYTEEEKDSLSVAADQIAVAIENARLTGEVGRDREQAQLIEAITNEVGFGDGIAGFYDSFVLHASRVIDFNQASMYLWHPASEEIEIVASRTEAPRTWLAQGLMLPRDSLATGRVIDSGSPLVRDEIDGDEYPTDKLLVEEGVRSAALFPLLSRGEVLGVIQLGSFESHAFSSEDVELLEPVTRQLGLVLDNIRVLKLAERSSLLDNLTGLYSHRYFFEVLKREVALGKRYGSGLSLIMFHIDGLQELNNHLGHANGDSVLREIAMILRPVVRDVDILARYSGRDFALLLPDIQVGDDSGPVDAVRVAGRIREGIVGQVFGRPEWAGEPLSISIGVADYPAHAADSASLLEKVDLALREARDRGLNEIVVAQAQADC